MPSHFGRRSLAAIVVCLPLLLGGAGTKTPQAVKGLRADTGVSGVPQGWLARARRGIAEREYHASRSRQGLQAPNRAQNLRTYFAPTGIRIHDRTAAGSPELLALSLAGIGRGATLAAPKPASLSNEGARVEIRRGPLLEWYENSSRGLEQGFTLAQRPAGAGPLALELTASGATASLRGDAVVFTSASGRRLRYGALRARDAAGRQLAARLALTTSGRVRLEVADAGAVYPVVVDPLITDIWDARLESDQLSSLFGMSVAGAGDVNGDGYADVIVGARNYDTGQGQAGAAFVFLGSAAGIADGTAATADAQLESDQVGAWFGASVAGAGDVNGDGYADVIVGAPRYDTSQQDAGAAFVFLGSAAGIASGGPATAAAQLESDQAGEGLGTSVAGAGDVNGDGYADVIVSGYGAYVFLGSAAGIASGGPASADARLQWSQSGSFLVSVAGAGDVNGDGYADVIVGAGGYDAGAGDTNDGAAFVFLGSAAGIADGSPATADARLESDQAGAELGTSVAGAGDVNGDGYADVIVGAPRYSDGETQEGAAFVFLGGAAGIADAGPATAAARLESDQAGADLGESVAGAGDVNGDGYADLIVGAPYYEPQPGYLHRGVALVFLGSATGIASGGPATAYAQLQSDQPDDTYLGESVAGAGDVNGDGYADLIVGAPYYVYPEERGEAFVFLGRPDEIQGGDPTTANVQLESNQAGANLGASVSGAGDVNGDGYADVVVGAPDYDTGQGYGATFVFLGSAVGISDSPDTELATFGSNVAGAGDVNGDGYADLIVGAPWYGVGGGAFLFLGSPSGIPSGDVTSAQAQLVSDQDSASFGVAVAGAGDVNGDGYADVMVSAPGYDAGPEGGGVVFVFLGSAAGIASGGPATAQSRITSGRVGDYGFGQSIAAAGDVNGDGYADVIVGDAGYSPGEALVFLGSAAGIADADPQTADTRLQSSSVGFGASVAGAGDVNGDGYADVIVGDPLYYNPDTAAAGAGAAYVFLGSAAGIADSDVSGAQARIECSQADAAFGGSVAGAGDVNGDGYADVIASASSYDAGQGSEGAAFVFLGSASGIASGDLTIADARLDTDQLDPIDPTLRVAGTGDVNGDGYADLILGAPSYDAGETDEGAAFVFLGGSGLGGRSVVAEQLRGDASGIPVAPWGSSDGGAFQVALTGTHPEGRGRVKLEVEACPSGVAFGDPTCVSHLGASWSQVTPASADGVRLVETVDGLALDTLYHWRARVLQAPATETPPLEPPHGPWHHVEVQALGADVRVVPEPGSTVSFAAGALALAALRRSRRGRRARTDRRSGR